jgi:hypothetical protein
MTSPEKPLGSGRVLSQIRQKLPDVAIDHPTSEGVSKMIKESCEAAPKRFKL